MFIIWFWIFGFWIFRFFEKRKVEKYRHFALFSWCEIMHVDVFVRFWWFFIQPKICSGARVSPRPEAQKKVIFCTGYVFMWAAASRQRSEDRLRRANTTLCIWAAASQTAARRPTAASQHNPMYIYIWAAASQQRPEGRLRRANTTLCIYIYTCTHHTSSSIDPHAINQHNPFIAHCSGSMLSLVWVRIYWAKSIKPYVCKI